MNLQIKTGQVSPTDKLPRFAKAGHLPAGVFDCTLDELALLVRYNERRRRQWLQLASFLSWVALTQKFLYAYIGGGFISTKSVPGDIDVILETESPYGPESFAAVAPFFVAGLDQIEQIYGVHLQFWMQNAPSGISDYRVFFQYDRPEDPTHVLNRSRGLARLNLTDPDLPALLGRYFRQGDGLYLKPPLTPPGSVRQEAERLPGMRGKLACLALENSQMVAVMNRTGHVEWVNQAFESMSGYTLLEIQGRMPGHLLQGEQTDLKVVEKLHQAVELGHDCQCQIVNYRKDGTAYLAGINMEPIYGREGLEGFVALEDYLGSITDSPVHRNILT